MSTQSSLQSGGGSDAFVAELDSNGGLLYSTYFGGKRGESANGVAVDAAGSIYVTGASSSPNFQVTAGAFQRRGVQPDTFLVLNGP